MGNNKELQIGDVLVINDGGELVEVLVIQGDKDQEFPIILVNTDTLTEYNAFENLEHIDKVENIVEVKGKVAILTGRAVTPRIAPPKPPKDTESTSQVCMGDRLRLNPNMNSTIARHLKNDCDGRLQMLPEFYKELIVHVAKEHNKLIVETVDHIDKTVYIQDIGIWYPLEWFLPYEMTEATLFKGDMGYVTALVQETELLAEQLKGTVDNMKEVLTDIRSHTKYITDEDFHDWLHASEDSLVEDIDYIIDTLRRKY